MVINKLKSVLLLAVVVAAICSWNHIDINSEAISSRSIDSAIRDNQKDGYEVPNRADSICWSQPFLVILMLLNK